MDRYAQISEKFPREFILLQGTGCQWHRCTFCDYPTDVCSDPFATNRPILEQVTGRYGVLDVINSGSALELDEATLQLLEAIVRQKQIHTLWFESHYRYRHQLADFAARFPSVQVKFRCGVESFDPDQRIRWRKGIPADVTPEKIARYFQGVCLLCGTEGESRERLLNDVEIARRHFEYASINLFCNNTTNVRRDEAFARWFIEEVYPRLKEDPQFEILLDNTDLGVG